VISRNTLAAAALALAVTAAGPVPRPIAAANAGTATWQLRLAIQYVPTTNRSEYRAVLAEPGVTWFFGGSNVGGSSRPEIERLSNGHPVKAHLPPGPHSWITAVSATSRRDIWAVTYAGGSVLRWQQGSGWSTVPRGTWRPGTRFTGIIAIGPRDVWVFGTTSVHFIGAGTWHFTGTAWSRATGPGAGLFQASVAAPGDIWGIGVEHPGINVSRNLALLHFAGSGWRRVSPAALAGFVYSHVLALGPHDVWVAGSVAGRPELGHFDGSRWTALHMPGSVAATGMCRDGSGGLWVVANTGTSPSVMRHRSARGAWTTSVVSSSPADQILACALEPGTTRAWGAGKAAAPQGSAAAGYRYG